MINEEYFKIFKSKRLIRSPVVRIIEEQIRILLYLSKKFRDSGDIQKFRLCIKKAEEAKWEAIDFAEYEKENGLINIF